MLRLHELELEHLIEPPVDTIADQLGIARLKSQLLDGFMPSGEHKMYIEDIMERMLESKKAVALSVTFKPKFQKCDEETMKKVLVSNLAWIHNHIDMSFALGLVPDEDLGGNYHYHGVLVIKARDIRHFKRYMTMFNGFIKTSYISDTEKWKDYVFKSYTGKNKKRPEQIFTKDEINQLSIVYDCT